MTLATPLEVHLRALEIHRRTLRLVTLRPQCGVRFSTNYFHDTWHILAGPDGAALLGRLLWGLAFQRQPGTLVLIDHPHLVPTPFEADPPDPILLVPDGLTRVDDDLLRALKLRLRRAPGRPRTIRWQTFGMAGAATITDGRAWIRDRKRPIWTRERMSRRAGFVCYTAPPEVLRAQGVAIHGMGGGAYHPMAEVDGPCWHHDGEVQVLGNFASKVAAARAARRALFPGAPGLLAGTEDAWTVSDRADLVLLRLREMRRARRG
jgi:hypothetical protein